MIFPEKRFCCHDYIIILVAKPFSGKYSTKNISKTIIKVSPRNDISGKKVLPSRLYYNLGAKPFSGKYSSKNISKIISRTIIKVIPRNNISGKKVLPPILYYNFGGKTFFWKILLKEHIKNHHKGES